MGLSESEMGRLATVCNRYPVVELSYELAKQSFSKDEPIVVDVTLTRADDDEESLLAFEQPAFAQYYPMKKYEEWWIVIGHVKSGSLLSIKKITNFRSQQLVKQQLKFTLNNGVDFLKNDVVVAELRLYAICDSYVGADLQQDVHVKLQ